MPQQKNLNNWTFHPARNDLIAEAHARPALQIPGPAEIIHIAFRCKQEIAYQFFDALVKGDKGDDPMPRHLTGTIRGVRVKLERHTEFMSCSLFQDLGAEEKPGSLDEILQDVFPINQVEIFTLIRLRIVKTARDMVRRLPIEDRAYGGNLRHGIEVRSTFKPDEAGFINFIVLGKSMTSDELGRRIQRLIEMETYRTMALLGLPKARSVSGKLTEIETELDMLTKQLRDSTDTSDLRDEDFFRKLSDLSERANLLVTETRYRFAASRAYFALFQQRVASLQEEKVGDVQTMSGFLRSRLEPAIATIESTGKRQQTLTEDLSRALSLLRTRIELSLNKGNQAVLKSMDKRHDQQLKISQAVEGLSIIAITYYAVGLVSHLLKALAQQPWMPLSTTVLTAISVPLVFAFVWYTLRRARKSWVERKQ
ncbi:MAG: DUF3422 domain-containing protein [Pseudomonadota bacterium]